MSVLRNVIGVLILCSFPVTFAAAQVILLPAVPRPVSAEQVVGANLQNPTTNTLPAHAVQLGQAFRHGDLPGNSGIAASINGTTVPAQIDVKTKYPDGSARFGVITVMAPALPPGSVNPTMFSKGPRDGAAVSLATMPGFDFKVVIQFSKGATGSHEFDAAQLLSHGLRVWLPRRPHPYCRARTGLRWKPLRDNLCRRGFRHRLRHRLPPYTSDARRLYKSGCFKRRERR